MNKIRKMIFITICVMVLYSCNQQRPAVIDRPVFDVWSSDVLEIDKIEMSDSATVFYVDAYYQPNRPIKIDHETFIRKSGSDEKFPVIRAEGINLDEATIMPESGMLSFKLFFPPLKRGITKIDFMESDYKIWGIRLLPNAKIKFDPVPKDALKTTTEPLPTPEYSTEPARISGRMLGYIDGMEPDLVTITSINPIHFGRNYTALPVAKDGSFSGEFIPSFAGIYESSEGFLFLTPSEETKLYVDLKKRSRYQSRYRTDKEPSDSIFTYISGRFTSAELETINDAKNYYSYGISIPDRLPENQFKFKTEYLTLLHEIEDMNREEVKQYVLDIMNKRLYELKQKNYSPNMQTMMEIAIKNDTYYSFMECVSWLYHAYLQKNNVSITPASREEYEETLEIRNRYIPERPRIEYYSFLKGKQNDNISYLTNSLAGLGEYISHIEGFYLAGGNKENTPKERLDYFNEKWNLMPGDNKSLLFDLIQPMFYGYKLLDMEYFTEIEKQEIRDLFKDKPIYAEELIGESDRIEFILAAEYENNGSIKNDPPDVPQEQMLNAILAKYKGKVVVADVWGTWCPSCMQDIRNMPPFKDEMKDKDVVFLYLADETSPLNIWEKTIPAISGEHYRLSKAQTRYWEVNSYPIYTVYDRQGKQIAKFYDFPGVEVMKKTIEKGL